ncbi:hypothetical protein CHS0354_022804 [Potamilus streckersoni]|uniref:Peptidase M12B domain-containing protein n=1 Tax=Potamilus streckersoni TaxID=2493646 RepID=A0AAE0VMJ9_9BIVA|nr:hypothetical protein CHS0354_022804 [Potamilus streckersoni]
MFIATQKVDLLALEFASVCLPGFRTEIVHSNDYFLTTTVAAHELGHSLGADHDGEGNATACNPDDLFIMTPRRKAFHPGVAYTKNPWLFSNCSVEAFKKTLENKDCVTRRPNYTEVEMDELNNLNLTQPGEEYTRDMQCQLIKGRGSVYCGIKLRKTSIKIFITQSISSTYHQYNHPWTL